MAEDNKKQGQNSGQQPTPPPPPPYSDDGDDSVVFDLTGDAPAKGDKPDLHINLEQSKEENATKKTATIDATIDLSDDLADTPSTEGSFSLSGDSVMDVFETLQRKIDEETKDFLESQKNHRKKIEHEKAAMEQEQKEYELKKKKMLQGLEQLKSKLATAGQKKSQ